MSHTDFPQPKLAKGVRIRPSAGEFLLFWVIQGIIGIICGLSISAIVLVFAALVWLLGSWPPEGLSSSFSEFVGTIILAGLAAGAIFGVLLPLTRWRVGQWIAATMLFVSFGYGMSRAFSPGGDLVISLIWGSALGLAGAVVWRRNRLFADLADPWAP